MKQIKFIIALLVMFIGISSVSASDVNMTSFNQKLTDIKNKVDAVIPYSDMYTGTLVSDLTTTYNDALAYKNAGTYDQTTIDAYVTDMVNAITAIDTYNSTRTIFKVKFNTDGGTTIADQIVTKDDVITVTNPTKTTWHFAGWYKGNPTINPDYNLVFDITEGITEDMTLTALWSRRLILNVGDGFGYVDDEYADEGFEFIYTSAAIGVVSAWYPDVKVKIGAEAENGWKFVNWTVGDTDVVYSTDAVLTVTVAEDMELKANFEKLPYTILDIDKEVVYTARDESLTIAFNIMFTDFDFFGEVYLDNELVDENNYRLEEDTSGFTVANINSNYIKTLSKGKHTLTFTNYDGDVSVDFYVEELPVNPNTLDIIDSWYCVFTISLLGMSVALLKLRK